MTRASVVADHPLRQVRHRRGLTQAGLAGLSYSCISMIERGHRRLTRRDHVNALAAALRVPAAGIAPGVSPGLDEWAPAPPTLIPAFPPVSDDIAVARHRELAMRLIGYMRSGDMYAAGAWLRRMARDSSVNPCLLLDQLTARAPSCAAPSCARPRRRRSAPSPKKAQRRVPARRTRSGTAATPLSAGRAESGPCGRSPARHAPQYRMAAGP